MNQLVETDRTHLTDTNGILYIVPTPIGNLADITQRALTILAQVDFVAAEDTRHSGLLLQHYAIKARFLSLHDHNEQQKSQMLLEYLRAGKQIALISDAGTPLINDPGYHLVSLCRQQQIKVVPLPGPCAAITALSAAGLPSDRFCYEGFLPNKTTARLNYLIDLAQESRTLIFYESPKRVIDTLQDMQTAWGADRYVVLARELTKTWESIYGAPLGELLHWLMEDEHRYKGEIVLLVKGADKLSAEALPAQALQTLALLQQELPLKKAAALTAQIHQLKKNSLYQYALSQQKIRSHD